MRVAAIDCGTNSIRLLIAEERAGRLHDLVRTMQVVRLGEGVDRTGRLSEAALQRTFAACAEYAAMIAEHDAAAVRFVATSASRDAANAEEFAAGVAERIGVRPEVISGAEEAALSFTGATGELPPGRKLVADIGGGSTELVLGADRPEQATSVDVGCVRLTERRLHGDPPSADQIAAAVADIEAGFDQAAALVAFDTGATLVGLAGSVTTVAALALGLERYDSTAIHGSRIPAADVHRITEELLAMSRTERLALPVMHPGRADVIGGGALVLDRLVRRTGAPEVLVSEHDILDGIVWSVLRERAVS
jgi:exopolyphosphatase/guanosine-5'-triphosphate,3'-diphosphate pyrophosphatase